MTIQPTISKEDINQLPKAEFSGRIYVILTEDEANRAVNFLLGHQVLGIDSETRPSFAKGQTHKVALLQVATDEACFLFRLNRMGLPPSLIRLLESTHVVKVGLSLKDDFLMLKKRAPFKPASCIDLQDCVTRFGIQDKSLQKIYANLFGEKISKSQQLSNWESDVLTEKQQQYAATDAWACLRIYRLLQTMNPGENAP